jgi:hypothetical protein
MRKKKRPQPPDSWEELFEVVRRYCHKQMTWLPPFAATGHYLDQLEQAIRSKWKLGERIPALDALLYGILLGDVVVRRFGAKWVYSKWTPKVLNGDDILDHIVELVGDDDGGFACKPVLTVVKFVDNPDHTLTSVYDCFEAVASGELSWA